VIPTTPTPVPTMTAKDSRKHNTIMSIHDQRLLPAIPPPSPQLPPRTTTPTMTTTREIPSPYVHATTPSAASTVTTTRTAKTFISSA